MLLCLYGTNCGFAVPMISAICARCIICWAAPLLLRMSLLCVLSAPETSPTSSAPPEASAPFLMSPLICRCYSTAAPGALCYDCRSKTAFSGVLDVSGCRGYRNCVLLLLWEAARAGSVWSASEMPLIGMKRFDDRDCCS